MIKKLNPFCAALRQNYGDYVMMRCCVFLAVAVALGAGCSTGVNIALRDSSGINVGSISLENSSWPIVSYFTGPTFNLWVREDLPSSVTIDGSASMTNSTSALGIYDSTEVKSLSIHSTYSPPPLP